MRTILFTLLATMLLAAPIPDSQTSANAILT